MPTSQASTRGCSLGQTGQDRLRAFSLGLPAATPPQAPVCEWLQVTAVSGLIEGPIKGLGHSFSVLHGSEKLGKAT